jgi:succinoglycan biosynthesis protein ExoO
MIRRSLLDRCAERYDENLRIGEDDALIVRLLLAGAHYVVVPEPYYRYRKHGTSISHRLSLENIERLATSEARLREQLERKGRFGPEYRRRYRALANAVAFTRAIDALQRRQPWAALRAVLSRPSSMRLFAMPIKARLVRLRARAAHLARSLLT